MNTLFLLIVLTQNGAGDVNASFVNTRTMAQCLHKASIVESVFKSSNIQVIEKSCIKSDMTFSEFGHASVSRLIRNFYLITFKKESTQISVMPGWKKCMDLQKEGTKRARVYCASSVQSLN